MKKILSYFLFWAFALLTFTACEENINDQSNPEDVITGPVVNPITVDPITGDTTATPVSQNCYIINYGSYGKGGSSISRYDFEADVMYNNFNKTQNGGIEFTSNIQSASAYNNELYFMGNSPDQVFNVDKYMIQAKNGVTADIEKPRFSVGYGNYLYISCWGANPDWNLMPGSYIAKFNINTRTVEQKISLPGGPEGLEIANGKLYAALNYKDSVAVINLSNNAVSYIATPAVCSYFLKDKSNNLYVSLISTYSDYSLNTGLGYINTNTDVLATTYQLADVSTEYASIMAANSDFSKIYIISAAYDSNWVMQGSVNVFDTNSKTYTKNIITNLSGPKGLTINPKTNDLYVMTSEGSTVPGLLKIYNATGGFKKQHSVGLSPGFAFFQE